MSGFKKKIAFALKHNLFLLKLYRFIFSGIFRFLGLFIRINPKLILFSSFGGDRYDDSPKVLFEAIKNDNFFNDYQFYWGMNDANKKIEGATTIKMDSFKYFITALKSRIWITNVNIERGLKFKKRGTIYLNTWHGTSSKKVGNAVKGRKDYDFSNCDILCVDGEYYKNIFVKYFKAKDNSFLYCGRPREDGLFNKDCNYINSIKEKLGIDASKKVLFYAPTWRDYKLKPINWNLWRKLLGSEYVILTRFHHFTNEANEDLPVFDNEFFYDVTNYENLNDLYLVSDFLITDYSSCMFDFGLLKKPYYSFATDYEKYLEYPGSFFDLDDVLYCGVFKDEILLIKHIMNCDYEKDSRECFKVTSKICQYYGHATDACIEKIKQKISL